MSIAIQTEEELEERLSRPSDADAAAMASLDGDLLILGAGGKMGPSLARRARRAAERAGISKRIIAVARFSNQDLIEQFRSQGIETITADLLEPGALSGLPDIANVIFMAARKFGTSGAEHLTWAMNTYLPGMVAERYRNSRIVAFSTGNVYPLRSVGQGGATEFTPPEPVGEYGQSALGRERMFEYAASKWNTQVAILRLNYAIDLRYGVLPDIGRTVYEGRPVDVRMGLVNVIWQGDANAQAIRALELAASPPFVVNVTGPERLSVRETAAKLGALLGVTPRTEGTEAPDALLSDTSLAQSRFGPPDVSTDQLIEWVASWVARGGTRLGKATKFEVRDGRY